MLSLATLFSTALALAPQQGGGGSNSNHIGTSYLLVSPTLGAGLEFPGVFGVLRLDPGSMVVAPLDENALPARDLLDGLGAVAHGLAFQVLRTDERGLHLTSLRRVGEERRLRLAQVEALPQARARAYALIRDVVGT